VLSERPVVGNIPRSRRFREGSHFSSLFFRFVSKRRGDVPAADDTDVARVLWPFDVEREVAEAEWFLDVPLSDYGTVEISPRQLVDDDSGEVGRPLRGGWPAGPVAHRWSEIFGRLGLDISDVGDVQTILDALLHELSDATRTDVGVVSVREGKRDAGLTRPVQRILMFDDFHFEFRG
jgi:hypothetical protein